MHRNSKEGPNNPKKLKGARGDPIHNYSASYVCDRISAETAERSEQLAKTAIGPLH